MPLKLDLAKQHKAEYATPRTPVFIRTTPAKYLAILGDGPPTEPPFQAAIGALYGVAFTVKMARKFAGRDYVVSRLEGVWWAPAGKQVGESANAWRWQLLIRVPSFITAGEVSRGITQLRAKSKGAEVSRVKLITLREGQVVQMLHVGPYDKEQPTMDAMKAFATANKRRISGKHHEIYLSNPRRVAPEKLRTILRYPVRPA